MDEGQIIVHTERNALGAIERETFRWEGGPVTRISLGYPPMAKKLDGNRIKVGPYVLRCLDPDFMGFMTVPYVREDWPLWWVLVGWHRVSRLADLVYRRLILTLAVWGLAEFREGAVPSWRDIKIFRVLSKSEGGR